MDIIPHFPEMDSPDPEIRRFGQREYLTDYDIYQAFLELAVERTASAIGYLHRYCPDSEEIQLSVWSQQVFEQCTTAHETHYPLQSAGIWADSVRQGRTVIHNESSSLEHSGDMPAGHFPVWRHMSAGAHEGDRVVGIIGVGNKADPYTDADREQLEQLLAMGWPVVQNRLAERVAREQTRQHLYEDQDLHEVMFSLLRAVGRAVELRDRYTSRHQSNVTYICDAIGYALDMSEERRFGLRLGASIHDIGKLGVPADILNTPRQLTPAEMALVRTHPSTGAALFSTVRTPWPLQDMIRQHHERMDGSGYPDGLTREQICLEARIIAVADTFDAIASHRPYRAAIGKVAAIEALREGRGMLYDPYAVDALERLLVDDPLLSGESMYRF